MRSHLWMSATVGLGTLATIVVTLLQPGARGAEKVPPVSRLCVVWGPSAKLLAESKVLQDEVKAMQKTGVVVEACVACAKNYGVVDALKGLGIDVKPMGEPLSQRLKGDWKVLTF
jgi:hypothetical protein